MRITNMSPQERIITIHIGSGSVDLIMGRPGARAGWDVRPSLEQIGEPPAPVSVDVEAAAVAAKVKPADLVTALKADHTYQAWLKDGVIAEA